jgi:Zn-finger domain-containing protein
MRKIFPILFVTLIIFTGASYAQDSPRVVAEKYLDAVRNNDYDTAYSFISKTDTTIIDWLALLKYIKKITPPKLTQVIDLAHRAVRQEIVSTSAGGNTAIVKIHSRVPDMEETFKVTQNPEDIKSLLNRGGLPMKERLGECTLVVEDGAWKISRIKGISSDQAAELATDFAELILGKDEARRISREISEFTNRQEKGV